MLIAESDYVATLSERVARVHASRLGLEIFEPPLSIDPYALSSLWHPRADADPGHRFLREAFVRAAEEAAPEIHSGARTRLRRR
jgi:hypothetical protein